MTSKWTAPYRAKYKREWRAKNLAHCQELARARYAANPERYKRAEAERYLKARTVIEEAKDKPCVRCKLRFPFCVMDFHHVRGEKKFCVGLKGHLVPTEVLLEEIAKCDVICANCHRILTYEKKRAMISKWTV